MIRVRTTISGWSGGPGLGTQYFVTPLQDAAAALRCATYVHDLWATALSGMFVNSVALTVQPEVDVLDSATGAITNTFSVAPPAVVAGAGGPNIAPPALAALLKLGTDTFVAGRRVRGRSYLSPLADGVIGLDGEILPAIANGKGAVLEVMNAATEPGDLWVVWHRPKLKLGGLAAPITSTSMPTKIAVLTSRRD